MKIHAFPQGSEEWHAIRLGKLTASKLGALLTPKTMRLSKQADGLMYQLVAEILTGEPCDEAAGAWAQRGKELEPEARDYYALVHDVDVLEVGFVEMDGGRVGCSPDGLVGEDGLVEIKCRNARNHVATLLGAPITPYIAQIQGQLWVCEREWCDLLFYSPAMPSRVERVERDEDYISALADAAREFCARMDEALARIRAIERPSDNPFI